MPPLQQSDGLLPNGIGRLLDFLYDKAGWLAAISLAGVAAAMLLQSASRQFGWGFVGGDELAAWLCAASTFLGLAHTQRRGQLVRMEVVLLQVKEPWRRRLEVLALAIASGAVGYAAVAMTMFVFTNASTREISQGLIVIPVWIPQSSGAIGLALLALAFIEDLVLALRGGTPRHLEAERVRAASNDFGETL